MKTPNILYFVNGVPNEQQIALALKSNAKIRNSAAYYVGDAIENCDEVMGDIPDAYLERYEKAKAHDAAVKLTKPKSAKSTQEKTETE